MDSINNKHPKSGNQNFSSTQKNRMPLGAQMHSSTSSHSATKETGTDSMSSLVPAPDREESFFDQGADVSNNAHAKAPTHINDFADHLIFKTMGHLKTLDVFQEFKTLSALNATSLTMKKQLSDYDRFDQLKQQFKNKKLLWDSLGNSLDRLLSQMPLNLVKPSDRDFLVKDLLEGNHEAEKHIIISKLALQLENLTTEQRDWLVEAALNLDSSDHKAMAIGGLGAGLQHLQPDQRTSLVQAFRFGSCWQGISDSRIGSRITVP